MSFSGISKVVVTGDLLRCLIEDGKPTWTQRPNVNWLRAVVEAILPDHKVQALTPESLGYTPEGLMEAMGLPTSVEGWAGAFEALPAGPVADAITELAGALVVGFELPPGMVSALGAAGAHTINLNLHPIRCLDDLYLSVLADASIAAHFAPHAVTIQEMRWKLVRMRARLARERAGLPDLPAGSAVLFGQLAVDRSLFWNGTFASLADFIEDIRALAEEFGTVYYRSHPFAQPNPDLAMLLTEIPGLLFTDRTAYELLDAPDIAAAFGISSSTLFEAHVFGKRSKAFIRHGELGMPPVANGLAVGLAGFAAGLSSLAGCAGAVFAPDPGALREIVGMQWGYAPGLINPLFRSPPVLPDHKICMADTIMQGARLSAWRVHADWGLWGVGPHSILEFRWPETAGKRMEVAVEMMAGPSQPHRKPTFAVHAGGHRVYTTQVLEFNEPRTIRFDIERPAKGDRFQLHFFSSDPQSPHQVGINQDKDLLATACFGVWRC